MRFYLFFGLLASALIIVAKYNLRDATTHRWNRSTRENRTGYVLLTLVFILFFALMAWA